MDEQMEFNQWLKIQLRDRNMRQSDLSRLTHMDPGSISNLLNGKRLPGEKSIGLIAEALDIPHEVIYRAAGWIPPGDVEIDDTIAMILSELALLSPIDKQDVLEYVRLRKRMMEKVGGN